MARCGSCGIVLPSSGACHICARREREARRYGRRHRRGYGTPEGDSSLQDSLPSLEKGPPDKGIDPSLRRRVKMRVKVYNRLLTVAFGRPTRISHVLKRNKFSNEKIATYKNDLNKLDSMLKHLDEIVETQSGIHMRDYNPVIENGASMKIGRLAASPRRRAILEEAILTAFRANES